MGHRDRDGDPDYNLSMHGTRWHRSRSLWARLARSCRDTRDFVHWRDASPHYDCCHAVATQGCITPSRSLVLRSKHITIKKKWRSRVTFASLLVSVLGKQQNHQSLFSSDADDANYILPRDSSCQLPCFLLTMTPYCLNLALIFS